MTAPPRPDGPPRPAGLRLVETMRAEGGRVALLDLHLARLARSGAALGFDVDPRRARDAVRGGVGEGAHALRLTVGRGGDVEVETRALEDDPFRTAWVDPEPLTEAGTWLTRHKTTARAHYAARYERARALGADEAVLVNADGLVTEGTRSTVWAERGGRLLTPALAAGGLGGVFRAHVLATDARAEEADLTPGDLRAAEAVWLTNAVRGRMRVRLTTPPV